MFITYVKFNIYMYNLVLIIIDSGNRTMEEEMAYNFLYRKVPKYFGRKKSN